MQQYKRDFIDFMMEVGVLTFGDFTTKSGRKTPYFVNTGLYRTGSQLKRLGEFYAGAIQTELSKEFDVIFGPAYKGIPLVATTSAALASAGHDVAFCFNRKEAKDHGEGGLLVGHKLTDGQRVLIIEDVTTAGTSIRETVPVLKSAADIQLAGLIVSVDRAERGPVWRRHRDAGSRQRIQHADLCHRHRARDHAIQRCRPLPSSPCTRSCSTSIYRTTIGRECWLTWKSTVRKHGRKRGTLIQIMSGKALAAGVAPFEFATNLPAASALPLTLFREVEAPPETCTPSAVILHLRRSRLLFAIGLFEQLLPHSQLRWRDFNQFIIFDVLQSRF